MAISFFLWALPTIAAADIYVYRHVDGTVLITEYPQTANPNYTLMEVKKSKSRSNNLPQVNVHNTDSVRPSKRISHSPYDSTIKAIALRYGVDDKLIKAIVRVESAFKPAPSHPRAHRD